MQLDRYSKWYLSFCSWRRKRRRRVAWQGWGRGGSPGAQTLLHQSCSLSFKRETNTENKNSGPVLQGCPWTQHACQWVPAWESKIDLSERYWIFWFLSKYCSEAVCVWVRPWGPDSSCSQHRSISRVSAVGKVAKQAACHATSLRFCVESANK